ncbi:thiamine-phosphate kinase [Rhodoligotrophos defluvii]|uniref:thiamine-phosphate kinase n=1 Tax=Rhodoligotrophos defluvii TaxID=2561934 RepID=UPI001EF09EDD|nr:thiamine-phosphate kinase [Rhodoligotrophos defluvii]
MIQAIFAPLAAGFAGAAGLRDDAAVVSPQPGMDLVVTTDSLVADVHFLSTDDPALIARKALRVNLSDLAAKGADARGYLLAIALSPAQDEGWLKRFAQGLAEDQARFGCPLIGGDTVATPGPLTITLTALGEVPEGRAVRRGGGRPGDMVYVSGTIGDGALGLKAVRGELSGSGADALKQRYWLPEPRLALVPALLAYATAAMDISDGLIGDLGLLCHASGVSADIEAGRVPLSAAAREIVASMPGMREVCLAGGDDYEILCAVPPSQAPAFEQASAAAGVTVTAIGRLVEGTLPPVCRDEHGRPMTFSRLSYSHIA